MHVLAGNRILSKIKFWARRSLSGVFPPPEAACFGTGIGSEPGQIGAVYVINLDRQTRRWNHFVREARRQRIRGNKSLLDFCQRVSAVDGREIDTDTFVSTEVETHYSLQDHYFVDPDPCVSHVCRKESVPVPMSPSEIAVAQSHVNTWRRILDDGVAYALVLEDDVFFERHFAEHTSQAFRELPRHRIDAYAFDLLYLSYREVDRGVARRAHSNMLFRPVRGLWWLSAYVLSLRGAEKLLRALPVRAPVDVWMNHQFSALDVLAISTPVISQRRDFKSDNTYSIIPILSQARAERNTTTIATAPDTSPRLRGDSDAKAAPKSNRQRTPVFGIGLNKTGTTSLHHALSLLGYKCCHWESATFSDDTAALIDGGARFRSRHIRMWRASLADTAS